MTKKERNGPRVVLTAEMAPLFIRLVVPSARYGLRARVQSVLLELHLTVFAGGHSLHFAENPVEC